MKPFRAKIYDEVGKPLIEVSDSDPVKLIDKMQNIVKKFR